MPFYTTKKDEYVFKKLKCASSGKHYIAQLIIPKRTRCYYSKSTYLDGYPEMPYHQGVKNRAAKAEVVMFFKFDWRTISWIPMPNLPKVDHISFVFDDDRVFFTYKTGEMIYPDKFCKKREVCSNGIHFYYNLEDALQW